MLLVDVIHYPIPIGPLQLQTSSLIGCSFQTSQTERYEVLIIKLFRVVAQRHAKRFKQYLPSAGRVG
jgi:hypothetical protein